MFLNLIINWMEKDGLKNVNLLNALLRQRIFNEPKYIFNFISIFFKIFFKKPRNQFKRRPINQIYLKEEFFLIPFKTVFYIA